MSDDDADGQRALALETLRSSARIVMAARRIGYLDESLQLTSKRATRQGRGGLVGFCPSNVVFSRDDIRSEAEFFTSGRAVEMAEGAGLDRETVERLVLSIVRYRP